MSSVFEQLIAQHMAGTSLSTESIDVEKISGQGPKGADAVDAKTEGVPMAKPDADESDLSIDELIDVTLDETKKMEEKQKEWEEGGRVHASLESLLHGTIDTYRGNGMNEQALNLYQLSVESALIAAGLNIPASVVVPSFEAADTQLAVVDKVEKKGGGILKTILGWMMKAFKYISGAVKKFVNLFRSNKKKVAERATRMVAMLEGKQPAQIGNDKQEGGEEGKQVSTEVKPEVKINANEARILSHGGAVASLGDASKAIKDNYAKSMTAWGKAFDGLINMSGAANDPVANLTKVSAALKSNLGNGFKSELNLNELLIVKAGSDKEWPMIGAKAEIAVSGEAKAGDVQVPDKAALIKLVQEIHTELENQSVAEKAMDEAAAHVDKTVAEYEKFDKEKDVTSSIDVSKATSNLMSATTVFSSGLALAGTHYVTGYNTLLNVVQRAVDKAA